VDEHDSSKLIGKWFLNEQVLRTGMAQAAVYIRSRSSRKLLDYRHALAIEIPIL
jgi:hypothetical protein